MGTFDFLSGMSGQNPNEQSSAPMQQYQQFANTGAPQGMDYSQILGGGQASPATQGLDFSKIGQWALQQNQFAGQQKQAPTYQQALAALAGQSQNPGPNDPAAYQLRQPQMGHAGGQLGQVQQGQAGYIGRGTQSGLLGTVR